MLKCSICGKTYKTTIERAQCEINCARQAEAQAEAAEFSVKQTADTSRAELYTKYLAERTRDREAIINLFRQESVAIAEYCQKHDCLDVSVSHGAGTVSIQFNDDDGPATYSFVSNPELLNSLMSKHIDTSAELNLVDVPASDENTQATENAAKEFCSRLENL